MIKVNHGYETPKQALETNSKARCGVLHPPLCGIVPNPDKSGLDSSTCVSYCQRVSLRLTNFNSLRFWNLSLTINKMRYKFAAIALAPFLIMQALYVRCVTPKLPEPSGKRSGVDGSGPLLRLLILGDSAAAGVGVSTQGQSLSGQLVNALGAEFKVSWKLIAQAGHKAKDVLRELTMASPESFDIVVTSIGVNDVTHGTMTKRWINQLGQMVELLQSKFHSRHIILSCVPPMHLFPALPQPLRFYIGSRAKQFNSALNLFADGCKACEFVTINFPMEAAYMADDGFHPGALAYKIWANQLAVVIRSRLAEEEFPNKNEKNII